MVNIKRYVIRELAPLQSFMSRFSCRVDGFSDMVSYLGTCPHFLLLLRFHNCSLPVCWSRGAYMPPGIKLCPAN